MKKSLPGGLDSLQLSAFEWRQQGARLWNV